MERLRLKAARRRRVILSRARDFFVVSPGYFHVLGAPLMQGRAFTDNDTENAPKVAIINNQMARHYWPKQDAIGHRFSTDQGKTLGRRLSVSPSNVHQYGLDKDSGYSMYFPVERRRGSCPRTCW